MTTGAFYIVAAVMLAAAIWAVTARNVLHAALALITDFFCTAILYLGLEAEFLAVAQVLVYIGGVVVFVVFAILLTTRLGDETLRSSATRKGAALLLAGALLVVNLRALLHASEWLNQPSVVAGPAAGSLVEVGRLFLMPGPAGLLLPFELASLLLLAAIVGAIAIARKQEEDEA